MSVKTGGCDSSPHAAAISWQAYRRVLGANTISSVGDGVCLSALPLLALAVTRDPRLIALVSAAVFVPWLALSLPTGVVVDRYDLPDLVPPEQLPKANGNLQVS